MQCILFNIVFISIVSLHVGQEKYHWIKMFSLSRCPSCPQWFSSTGCVNATGDQQMEIIFAITFRLLFFSLIFCFSSFIDFKFSLFFHLSLRFVTRIHNSWIFGFCFSILYLFLFFCFSTFNFSLFTSLQSIFIIVYKICKNFRHQSFIFFFFEKIQFHPNLHYGFYGILLYQNHRFLDILVLLRFFFFFFLYLLLYSSFSLCLQIYGFIFINRVIHKLYNF